MKPTYIPIFFFLSLAAPFHVQSTTTRILHQPFFPSIPSPPPPELQPPPPPLPTTPNQDQPFFHELPNGPTLDQGQQQSPPSPASRAMAAPAATPPSNSIKKTAIVISSAILAVGMLSALAFYLYKHLAKHRDDNLKLVSGNSRRNDDESRMPPSTFLYIGTVEPSARSVADDLTDASGSPYRKLNSGKRSSRYRPSPELHPLPPLPKPPPPPIINSPPPMSSSDDESHDTNFYTPQGSSMSNESPRSRHGYLNHVVSQVNQSRHENRVPYSKRTSPKSRLSASSPDTKPVIIPSIKQPPSPPPPPPPAFSLHPAKPLSYTPKRTKFPPPPPPLDIARLRSISNDDQQTPVTNPPPPPPPPPPPSAPRKFGDIEKHIHTPFPPKVPRSDNSKPNQTAKDEHDNSIDSEEKDGSKPKLKPLHWDKVRATSDRVTVWDQLNSSSFQLNEDAMETLFGCSSANSAPKEATRRSAQAAMEQEIRVLDPKKSQNIAILLRALNVTREEVSDALLDGNPEGLGPDLLETLVKMAPTKEEEIKLKDYNGDSSKLGSAERFLMGVLDIPFAFRRVEAMLYRANFDTEVAYLRKAFQALEEASEELKNSRLFLKLLEAVLRTGNRMNDGTNRGDARAFKLETLLKLVDVKGTDGKTTLLHFVVQEIIRAEGAHSDPTTASENVTNKTDVTFKEEEFKKQGLQVVSGLSRELGNVRKAAGMDSDVLSSYVSKLEMGLEKVKSVMQYARQSTQGKFFGTMEEFLREAVEEITRIKAEERRVLSLVKEVTEYFHGDAAKEEAHPFRIFMIVRDFLVILDNVCKDVGRMQDRVTMGAGRSFRMPATASLPVLNRYHKRNERSSDEDDDDDDSK